MGRRDLDWCRVVWPRPLGSAAALDLLTRLAAQPGAPEFVLELRGESGQVIQLLGTPVENAARLRRVIAQFVPGTTFVRDPHRRPVTVAREVRLSDPAMPFGGDKPSAAMATAIHAALAAVRSGEVLVLQVLLCPGLRPNAQADPSPTWWQLLTGSGPEVASSTRSAIRAKHARPGFSATVRIGVAAAEESRRQSLGVGLIGALRTGERPGLRLRTKRGSVRRLQAATCPRVWPLRLSPLEALTICGLPVEADAFPGLPEPHPRRLSAAPIAEGDLSLAVSNALGTAGDPIGLAVESLRTHLLITGQTGTGKSSATVGLLTQLMARGHGLIAIEPKNDLTHDLLARVPAHRRDDVVVLDPTDQLPVGLNPVERGSRATPEQVADSVLAIFIGMYSRGGLGARSADILYSATLTLARRPGSTLTDLPRLLTDAAFRRAVAGPARRADPLGLGSFWDWYETISESERAAATAPLMNKIRPVFLREPVRRVLGQATPRFDISQVFTENKILLVPLNRGLLGAESAHWIGALLVARIWETLQAQAAVSAHLRPTVAIALDEFQDYTHLGTDLGDALSQSRGLGGAWILNCQYLDQAGALKDAVLSHARSRMAFTPSRKDADEYAKGSRAQLDPIDFLSLGQYELYLDLQRRGSSPGWVSGRTEPLPPATSNAHALVEHSRRQYGAAPAIPDGPDASTVAEPSEQAEPAAASSATSIGTKPRSTR